MNDHDLEKLVSRHLDGRLSADEELSLQREILRNPAAREFLEDSRRTDELAAAGIAEILRSTECSERIFQPIAKCDPVRIRSYSRAWWLVPAALAAALGLAVLMDGPWSQVRPVGRPGTVITERPPESIEQGLRQASTGRSTDTVRMPGGPRDIRRDTVRDVLGVMGEDGQIYWFEVDRTRTLDRPDPSVRLAKGEL